MIGRISVLVAITAGAVACGPDSDMSETQIAFLSQREKQVGERLEAAASDTAQSEPVAKWILPGFLREVSGLALTPDGRILAHNDERGRVYVIDPKRGVILKHFSLGESGIVADFEGIAVAGQEIYLLASNGNVYQFREGAANADVPFVMHDTKLGRECEFEGIEIESRTGAFLLLCKVIGKKSDRDQIRIYRWLGARGQSPQVTTISVPLAEAVGANGWKELAPSDMTVDRKTGNYVIITGREKALIEITPEGRVVRSFAIPGNPQQPEGVAITADDLLVIADEGLQRPGDITLFPWRRASNDSRIAPPADSTVTN